jgi:hypothetical protein
MKYGVYHWKNVSGCDDWAIFETAIDMPQWPVDDEYVVCVVDSETLSSQGDIAERK